METGTPGETGMLNEFRLNAGDARETVRRFVNVVQTGLTSTKVWHEPDHQDIEDLEAEPEAFQEHLADFHRHALSVESIATEIPDNEDKAWLVVHLDTLYTQDLLTPKDRGAAGAKISTAFLRGTRLKLSSKGAFDISIATLKNCDFALECFVSGFL